MANIGIAEAARLAGTAQSTLHRAMRTGRLTFTKDAAGKRRIDVAELGRVFELKIGEPPGDPAGNGALPRIEVRSEARKITHSSDIDALHTLLDERERIIARQDEAMRDLRDRLDLEAAERRQLSERLTGLLTARAETLAHDGPKSRRWWRRWRHG